MARSRISVALAACVLAACGASTSGTRQLTVTHDPPHCRTVGSGLWAAPDRVCTPGEWIADRDVSRAHVCARSYNPRPGVDVSGPLKRRALAAYGLPLSASARYEADHLFPRWLGGATTLRNFWPELNYPHPQGFDNNPKDRLEFAIYKRVCVARTMTVKRARAVFEGDWRAGYKRLLGSQGP